MYGLGADPHTRYSAMSRDQIEAHPYLPLQLLEDDTARTRHGRTPTTDTERLQRALTAYSQALSGTYADRLILAELGLEPAPLATTPGIPRHDHPAPAETPIPQAETTNHPPHSETGPPASMHVPG